MGQRLRRRLSSDLKLEELEELEELDDLDELDDEELYLLLDLFTTFLDFLPYQYFYLLCADSDSELDDLDRLGYYQAIPLFFGTACLPI